jgi:hypothetical protein
MASPRLDDEKAPATSRSFAAPGHFSSASSSSSSSSAVDSSFVLALLHSQPQPATGVFAKIKEQAASCHLPSLPPLAIRTSSEDLIGPILDFSSPGMPRGSFDAEIKTGKTVSIPALIRRASEGTQIPTLTRLSSRRELKSAVNQLLKKKLNQYEIDGKQAEKIINTSFNLYYTDALTKGCLTPESIALRCLYCSLLALPEQASQQVIAEIKEHDDYYKLVEPSPRVISFTPLERLNPENMKQHPLAKEGGILQQSYLCAQLVASGKNDLSRHYTVGDLRNRHLSDRDTMLALFAAFARTVSPKPPQLFMLRGMGCNNPDSYNERISGAALAHFLNIPFDNVISLPGLRVSHNLQRKKDLKNNVDTGKISRDSYETAVKYINGIFTDKIRANEPELIAETKKTFVTQVGWTPRTEYNKQPAREVKDEAVEHEVALQRNYLLSKLEGNPVASATGGSDFTPIVLVVYGHHLKDYDTLGGNTAEDIARQLRWLGLEKLMKHTVTIVGFSCDSLYIVKQLAALPDFSNVVMACGTENEINPNTREPHLFTSHDFYYYACEKSDDPRLKREPYPLISDFHFSYKPRVGKQRVMSEKYDIEDLAALFCQLSPPSTAVVEAQEKIDKARKAKREASVESHPEWFVAEAKQSPAITQLSEMLLKHDATSNVLKIRHPFGDQNISATRYKLSRLFDFLKQNEATLCGLLQQITTQMCDAVTVKQRREIECLAHRALSLVNYFKRAERFFPNKFIHFGRGVDFFNPYRNQAEQFALLTQSATYLLDACKNGIEEKEKLNLAITK